MLQEGKCLLTSVGQILQTVNMWTEKALSVSLNA